MIEIFSEIPYIHCILPAFICACINTLQFPLSRSNFTVILTATRRRINESQLHIYVLLVSPNPSRIIPWLPMNKSAIDSSINQYRWCYSEGQCRWKVLKFWAYIVSAKMKKVWFLFSPNTFSFNILWFEIWKPLVITYNIFDYT